MAQLVRDEGRWERRSREREVVHTRKRARERATTMGRAISAVRGAIASHMRAYIKVRNLEDTTTWRRRRLDGYTRDDKMDEGG